MKSFKEIKDHYGFTPDDERRIGSVKEIMIEGAEAAMEALHAWVLQTRETAAFFTDEAKRKRVFDSHKRWFTDLFSGTYDGLYYERLIRIGQTHVKASVDAHFMNRAMNIVRTYCVGVLNHAVDDAEERALVMSSFEKLLDINLDVITSSYIEEELRTFSKAYRMKSALITFSEGFSQAMNIVLIFSLIGLTLGVVGLFVFDIQKFLTGNLGQGIITALGSLLVLWVMIELMNTEISQLKGGKFHISVFIGVALVAFIRETLIMTLKSEKPEAQYYLIALILVLGVVFWLVTKAEERLK